MKRFILSLLVCAVPLALSAKIVSKAVPYEHDGVKLEGYLAYDDAKTGAGLQPGVLVIHEWWGRNDFADHQARRLAELGYVALALDMYGAGVATTDAKEAGTLAGQFYGKPLMAQRAQAGLDQLLATGLVDPKRVAAIGFCFGGSTAMALAYSGAPLAGVVSFHGGPIPASAEAAARNQAMFLICHGAADPLVPKEALDRFLLSLEEGGIDYLFIAYQGAKHAFTNPEADRYAALNQINGIAYNAAAARRSWQHMQDFFNELFH
ncbi:MAG: dienelactone hydrolase family protein [Cephaloticoccus sp.]|nr:dienelactone hydrolase family protein [Cephaloticoccus sp.]